MTRFRKHGAPPDRQNRAGRRGAVFSVRLTDDERRAVEALQASGGGPRSLGPWLLWAALNSSGTTRARVIPVQARENIGDSTRAGNTLAGAGSTRSSEKPIIIDLCAGSGAWSEPYLRFGYRVIRVSLPDSDVRRFSPPEGVRGVLAAPPCDQFSLARNGHPSPRDFARGLETVAACLRVVALARPKWWALENPVGLLSRWLGTPRDVFEPCDFGDPWTKRTALWGDFELPRRGPFVRPLGGGPLCALCDPERRKTSWCNDAGHRAITPAGFARAFFLANP